MPSTSDPSIPEAAPSRRRDAILAEAARLFNENGFHDTRLSDVADRLGLVKTTISYHFRSKEALLQNLYGHACDVAEIDLMEALAQPTGLAGVRMWLRRNYEREAEMLSGQTAPLAIIGDLNAVATSEKEMLSQRVQNQASMIKKLLEKGQKDGSIASVSIEATTALLLGLRHWLRDWMRSLAPLGSETHFRVLESLLIHGLCADPSWHPRTRSSRRTGDALSGVFDRETRSQLKREAFVRAGTRFLNQQGYRNLSLQDVAADLGVSRGTFYYYIVDKEALLQESVERTLKVLEDAIDVAAQLPDDAVSQLWNVLRDILEGHASDLDPLIRLNLINALPPAQRAVARARYRKVAARFGQIIADGLVDGSIRTAGIDGAEQVVIGALFAANRPQPSIVLADVNAPPVSAQHQSMGMAYFQILFTGLAA